MKPEQEALSKAKECSEPAVEALPGNQGGEGRGKEFLFDDLFEMFCWGVWRGGLQFPHAGSLDLEELRLLLKGSQIVTEPEAGMIPPFLFFHSPPTKDLLPKAMSQGTLSFTHWLNVYRTPTGTAGTATVAGESMRMWPRKDFSRRGTQESSRQGSLTYCRAWALVADGLSWHPSSAISSCVCDLAPPTPALSATACSPVQWGHNTNLVDLVYGLSGFNACTPLRLAIVMM